jgi:hypothetical protein
MRLLLSQPSGSPGVEGLFDGNGMTTVRQVDLVWARLSQSGELMASAVEAPAGSTSRFKITEEFSSENAECVKLT